MSYKRKEAKTVTTVSSFYSGGGGGAFPFVSVEPQTLTSGFDLRFCFGERV